MTAREVETSLEPAALLESENLSNAPLKRPTVDVGEVLASKIKG